MRISDWSSDVCSSDLSRYKKPNYYTRFSNKIRKRSVLLTFKKKYLKSNRFRKSLGLVRRFSKAFNRRFNFLYKRYLKVSRSVEHTSELQSLLRNSYAVFCLKKKNKTICDNIFSIYT